MAIHPQLKNAFNKELIFLSSSQQLNVEVPGWTHPIYTHSLTDTHPFRMPGVFFFFFFFSVCMPHFNDMLMRCAGHECITVHQGLTDPLAQMERGAEEWRDDEKTASGGKSRRKHFPWWIEGILLLYWGNTLGKHFPRWIEGILFHVKNERENTQMCSLQFTCFCWGF